ncbi:MAG TPA: DUF5317 domain-containing protein [Actinomycetota bacterium]|nr:DUF5317 domain-containing protein [Actinomycetota bacterium]
MFTVVIFAVIAVLIGLARGGSLSSLSATRVRWLWLVYAGVLVQVAGALLLSGDAGLVVVIASNAVIAAFLLRNLRLPGMTLAAVGLVLNVLVIAANGAMPVSAEVIEAAGGSDTEEIGGLKHERLTDDTRFAFLGDVIAVPGLREVLSLGDVLLALGIAYFVFSRTTAEARRGRHSLAE